MVAPLRLLLHLLPFLLFGFSSLRGRALRFPFGLRLGGWSRCVFSADFLHLLLSGLGSLRGRALRCRCGLRLGNWRPFVFLVALSLALLVSFSSLRGLALRVLIGFRLWLEIASWRSLAALGPILASFSGVWLLPATACLAKAPPDAQKRPSGMMLAPFWPFKKQIWALVSLPRVL